MANILIFRWVGYMSKIIGSVGKSLEDVFMHNVMDRHVGKPKGHRADNKADVKTFVQVYRDCQLFDIVSGRAHPSFTHFLHSIQ